MNKPFILFSGETYYPAPGWNSYIGDFETLDNAIRAVKEIDDWGWWQVVDINTKKVIAGEGEGHTGMFGKSRAGPNE